MAQQIVIWGAGKIGRGFVADLFYHAGYRLTFVDADEELVKSLRERGHYTLVRLPEDEPAQEVEIHGFEILSTGERDAVRERVGQVGLMAVVVFPSIFEAVAEELAPAIEARAAKRAGQAGSPADADGGFGAPAAAAAPLDILVCANMAHPAPEFARVLREKLSDAGRRYLEEQVGLIETVILRIGIPPSEEHLARDPHIVVTNGYPELPVDRKAFKGALPEVPGLVFSDRIGEEEYRKIYCYNMAHAALGYAGYLKGYTYVAECARDPEIAAETDGALDEVARGLAAEYSFTEEEMHEYCAGIVSYLGNPALPDTVLRVAADPKRKIGPADRLIGPARICAAHGIEPRHLMRTVARALLFDPPQDESARELGRALKLDGASACLERYCGLDPGEPLHALAMEELRRLLGDERGAQPQAGRPPWSGSGPDNTGSDRPRSGGRTGHRAAPAAAAPSQAKAGASQRGAADRNGNFDAVVAGHICLDITPRFGNVGEGSLDEILRPGALIEMNGVVVSPGGAVTNTGTNLAKLGIETALVALTGTDEFGEIVRSSLEGYADVSGIGVTNEAATSYTVVLAPPGRDRVFLHDTGANDVFSAESMSYGLLASPRLLHFGYPPAMRQMFQEEGRELEELLRRAKEQGVTVSLDLSVPDPASDAGRAPWQRILERALPHVDLFLPSLDELAFMIDPDLHHRLTDDSINTFVDTTELLDSLHSLSEFVLDQGVSICGIKCGERGFYLRTSGVDVFTRAGRAFSAEPSAGAARAAATPEDPGRGTEDPAAWAGRELFTAPYRVEEIASATGAGDASIAGFLAAVLRGAGPEEALNMACAAGAATTTVYDTTSGINGYAELSRRYLQDGAKAAPRGGSGEVSPDKPAPAAAGRPGQEAAPGEADQQPGHEATPWQLNQQTGVWWRST
jgi:mannitol-1-phosphate/altronate dehydrogenase/sugar/nucleoside kinase (ribokinase family)